MPNRYAVPMHARQDVLDIFDDALPPLSPRHGDKARHRTSLRCLVQWAQEEAVKAQGPARASAVWNAHHPHIEEGIDIVRSEMATAFLTGERETAEYLRSMCLYLCGLETRANAKADSEDAYDPARAEPVRRQGSRVVA